MAHIMLILIIYNVYHLQKVMNPHYGERNFLPPKGTFGELQGGQVLIFL